MKKNNITFVIHPTPYSDFDILCLGDYSLLTKLSKVNKGSDLIKSSKFGGVSLLIMDTCDSLRDAMSCIKECEKLYKDFLNHTTNCKGKEVRK